MSFTAVTLEEAVATLGDVLTDRGEAAELVAIGGGSLLLLKLIDRPTKDLDLVAVVRKGQLIRAEPLPAFLLSAVRDVAAAMNLAENWLNAGPADLLDWGLPSGFETRLETRHFGSLTLHLAGRFDQICFKLYASVDQGPETKHVPDLMRLAPMPAELARAAAWCVTQDPSEGFAQQLRQAVQQLGGTHDT
jgi:hypothetical protein